MTAITPKIDISNPLATNGEKHTLNQKPKSKKVSKVDAKIVECKASQKVVIQDQTNPGEASDAEFTEIIQQVGPKLDTQKLTFTEKLKKKDGEEEEEHLAFMKSIEQATEESDKRMEQLIKEALGFKHAVPSERKIYKKSQKHEKTEQALNQKLAKNDNAKNMSVPDGIKTPIPGIRLEHTNRIEDEEIQDPIDSEEVEEGAMDKDTVNDQEEEKIAHGVMMNFLMRISWPIPDLIKVLARKIQGVFTRFICFFQPKWFK
jgi:hypothetical protein